MLKLLDNSIVTTLFLGFYVLMAILYIPWPIIAFQAVYGCYIGYCEVTTRTSNDMHVLKFHFGVGCLINVLSAVVFYPLPLAFITVILAGLGLHEWFKLANAHHRRLFPEEFRNV